MADIQTRLRDASKPVHTSDDCGTWTPSPLFAEAADEIDRLHAALADIELRCNHFRQTLKEFGWGHKYTTRALDDVVLAGERVSALLNPMDKSRYGPPCPPFPYTHKPA